MSCPPPAAAHDQRQPSRKVTDSERFTNFPPGYADADDLGAVPCTPIYDYRWLERVGGVVALVALLVGGVYLLRA